MASKSSTSDDRTAIDSLSKRMDRMRQMLEEMLARMDGAPAPVAPAVAAPAPSPLVFLTSPAMSETPAASPTIASASIDTTTSSPATTWELLPTVPARCSTPGGSHDEHVLAPVVAAFPVPSSPTAAAAATTGVVITNTSMSTDAGLTVEEPTSSTKQVHSKLMVTPSTSSLFQGVPSSSSVEISSKSSNSSTGAQKVFDEMVPQQAVFIGVALDTMKHNHITVLSTAVDSMVDGSTKEKGDYMLQDILGVRDHRIGKASVKRLRYLKKFKHCAGYMLDTNSLNCSIMCVLDEFLAVQVPVEGLLVKSEQMSTGDHRVFDRGKHIRSASQTVHSSRTTICNGDHMVFDRGKFKKGRNMILFQMAGIHEAKEFVNMSWMVLAAHGFLHPSRTVGFSSMFSDQYCIPSLTLHFKLTIYQSLWVQRGTNKFSCSLASTIAMQLAIMYVVSCFAGTGGMKTEAMQLFFAAATTRHYLHGMGDPRVERSWPRADCSSVEIYCSDQWRCSKQRSRHSELVKVIELPCALACEERNGTVQFKLHDKVIISTLYYMDAIWADMQKFSGDNWKHWLKFLEMEVQVVGSSRQQIIVWFQLSHRNATLLVLEVSRWDSQWVIGTFLQFYYWNAHCDIYKFSMNRELIVAQNTLPIKLMINAHGFLMIWVGSYIRLKNQNVPSSMVLHKSVASNKEILVDHKFLSIAYLSTYSTYEFWAGTQLLELFQYKKFPCLTPTEIWYSFHQGRVQLFYRGINRTDHYMCLTTLPLECLHNNYQMDVQLDKAEQVLIHQKGMTEAKDPHRRLSFVVCFFRLQAEVHNFSGGNWNNSKHPYGSSQQQTCWLECYLSPNDLPTSIIGVQAPWDPGGSVHQPIQQVRDNWYQLVQYISLVVWDLDDFKSGLGASRISSGGECHGLGRHVGLVGQGKKKASVTLQKEGSRRKEGLNRIEL